MKANFRLMLITATYQGLNICLNISDIPSVQSRTLSETRSPEHDTGTMRASLNERQARNVLDGEIALSAILNFKLQLDKKIYELLKQIFMLSTCQNDRRFMVRQMSDFFKRWCRLV